VQVEDGGRLGAVERGEQAGAQTDDAVQVDVAREAEPQPTVRVVGRVELGGRVGAARGGRGAADGGSDRGHQGEPDVGAVLDVDRRFRGEAADHLDAPAAEAAVGGRGPPGAVVVDRDVEAAVRARGDPVADASVVVGTTTSWVLARNSPERRMHRAIVFTGLAIAFGVLTFWNYDDGGHGWHHHGGLFIPMMIFAALAFSNFLSLLFMPRGWPPDDKDRR